MAKVLTLSNTFPDYHPAHGEKTNFAEKFKNTWFDTKEHNYLSYPDLLYTLNSEKMSLAATDAFWDSKDKAVKETKGHTIREGMRFKKEDMASVRQWLGAPYRSTQVILAPDIPVRTWNLVVRGQTVWELEGKRLKFWHVQVLAANDGLHWQDLMHWFPNPGQFQIIAWDKKIDYDKWLK